MNPIRLTSFASVLIALCVFAAPSRAQMQPPQQQKFHSTVLGTDRVIDVYLPKEAADDPSKKFDVIYVLDGDWNGAHVANVVTFMRQIGGLPPVIVVSLPNVIDDQGVNSRDHDLTPTELPEFKRSGGAPRFLQFLKTELRAYVDTRYPTSGVNHIHGHSFGGLFLFYVLVNDPTAFDGYMILDPAMWWSNHMFDPLIAERLGKMPKGRAIFVAGRGGEGFEGMGLASIEKIFKEKAPTDLGWAIFGYPHETHDSMKLKGTYDGLKFVYDGFSADPIEMAPSGGRMLAGKPVTLVMARDNERVSVRYTTDGTRPNLASPLFDHTTLVNDPAKTHIAIVSNRGVFDRELPHNLVIGPALRPDLRAAPATKPEATWQVAYYDAKAWPKLRRAKPFKTEQVAHTDNFASIGRDDFALTASATLTVAEDGYYVFAIESADVAHATAAGTAVVDNDGSQGHHQTANVMPLQRGTYTIHFEARHPRKDAAADFAVFRMREPSSQWWTDIVLQLGPPRH